MENSSSIKRVLSIQSHVVSGYVGNKAATFPMQLLGFDVDCINTVHFSNHTGYPHFSGQKLTPDHFDDIFEGLIKNKLCHYSHLLTGYIGNALLLKSIKNAVLKLKQMNPSLIYVCDPVMGDGDQLYVPKESIQIYRDEVLPLCDVIVPNGYEAQLLTRIEINSKFSALKAIQILHETGIQTVIITSCSIPEISNDIIVFCSRFDSSTDKYHQFYCQVARIEIDGQFTGTGDLFAALALCWTHQHSLNIDLALQKTLSSIHRVLKRTFEHYQQNTCSSSSSSSSPSCIIRYKELLLIQSKNDIENPCPHCFDMIPIQQLQN